MNTRQKHIIHKVRVEVYTRSQKTGERIQQNISEFIRDEMLEWLESYLKEFEERLEEKQHLRFNDFSIDLNVERDVFFNFQNLPNSLEATKVEFFDQLERKISPSLKPLMVDSHKSNGHMQKVRSKGKDLNEEQVYTDTETKGDLGNGILNFSDREFEAWLYFIKNGVLPWWKPESDQPKNSWSIAWLVSNLVKERENMEVWEIFLQPAILKRLFYHYSQEEVALLFISCFLQKRFSPSKLVSEISSLPRKDKESILYGCIACLGSSKPTEAMSGTTPKVMSGELVKTFLNPLESYKSLQVWAEIKNSMNFLHREVKAWMKRSQFETKLNTVNRVLTGKIRETQVDKPGIIKTDFNKKGRLSKKNELYIEEIKKEGNPKKDEPVDYYFHRIGLILLYPFLPSFFDDCEVWDPNNKVWKNQDKAALLLHYAATQVSDPWEYEIGFEKFLCDIPLNQPLLSGIKLSEQDKVKTDRLLESLLEHWKNIKNTSADTIRVEFLQRSGKMEQHKNSVTLFIERKAQDVLLSGLDWSLGMFRLPWKKELIVVNWY